MIDHSPLSHTYYLREVERQAGKAYFRQKGARYGDTGKRAAAMVGVLLSFAVVLWAIVPGAH